MDFDLWGWNRVFGIGVFMLWATPVLVMALVRTEI